MTDSNSQPNKKSKLKLIIILIIAVPLVIFFGFVVYFDLNGDIPPLRLIPECIVNSEMGCFNNDVCEWGKCTVDWGHKYSIYYKNLALEKDDPAYCNNVLWLNNGDTGISKGDFAYNGCLIALSIDTLNPTYCSMIRLTDHYNANECYKILALRLQREDLCDEITAEQEKTICLEQFE